MPGLNAMEGILKKMPSVSGRHLVRIDNAFKDLAEA